MDNILNQLNNPAGQVPAPVVAPVAPAGYVAPVAPVMAPAAPVYAPGTAIPIAGAAPAPPQGGGGRLSSMRDNMRQASAGGGRNDIALGKAWYVLKDGKFTITDRKKTHLTNFTFICVRAISDKDGLAPGTVGYTGAIVGEEYSTALFQVGDYVMNSNLSALRACMGWTPEQVKARQANDVQCDELCQYVVAMTGYNPETGQGTGQPCCFANQIILEMSAKLKIAPVKVNGVQVLDAQTQLPMTKEHKNTFWDKRIRLGEAQQAGVPNEVLLKAFGDVAAWERAIATEQVLDQQV